MYYIKSNVIHGKGLGNKYGFPTANLDTSSVTNMPKCGVYASICKINNKKYISVTNVGKRPTFDNDDNITIETNVLNYDGILYGLEIELELCFYIRDIKSFISPEQLLNQINKDRQISIQLLSEKL